MRVNLDRIKNMYHEMASVGRTIEGGVTRIALTQSDKEARDLFVEWLRKHDLEVRVDDIGNVYGRIEGTDSQAKPIVLGSHLDSIDNSGTFDGALGLISALEVVQTLKDNAIKIKNPIEIANFTNEEGLRFSHLMAGSGVLSNDYDLETVYNEKDKDGNSFFDELKSINYLGDKENRLEEAEAFIELHIEQGPVLDSENIPIGAVEGTFGANWLEIQVIGEESNSGPTPMNLRKDPVTSTAKMILEINKLTADIGSRAITTVGDVRVKPGIVNTIPGEVTFLVDVRGENKEENDLGLELVSKTIKSIAERDGLQIKIKTLRSVDPTFFSSVIINAIVSAADELGYPVKKLISGAGHIASFMNNFCPTAMIFVPSVDGKSHSPEELTRWDDIEIGANTLLFTILNLVK